MMEVLHFQLHKFSENFHLSLSQVLCVCAIRRSCLCVLHMQTESKRLYASRKDLFGYFRVSVCIIKFNVN